MRSVVLKEPGNFCVVEKEYPHKPNKDEVLLKTVCLGVCSTDLHAYHGRQPFFTI